MYVKSFVAFVMIVITMILSSTLGAQSERHGNPKFKYVVLNPPGCQNTTATAINNAGTVVIHCQMETTTSWFLYKKRGFHPLEDVNSGGQSYLGINKSENLSGFTDQRGYKAFLVFQNLLHVIQVRGSSLTEGAGLNDRNEYVGDFRDAATGAFHGFRARGAHFATIDIPNSTGTAAYGINNKGWIVGTYDLNNDPNNDRHGFLLREDSVETIDVPGMKSTAPRAINDAGTIAGTVSDTGDIAHGYVSSDGNPIVIDIPGAIHTQIWGINNDGDFVGSYLDPAQVRHAFVGNLRRNLGR